MPLLKLKENIKLTWQILLRLVIIR